jgi:hypothetical protein
MGDPKYGCGGTGIGDRGICGCGCTGIGIGAGADIPNGDIVGCGCAGTGIRLCGSHQSEAAPGRGGQVASSVPVDPMKMISAPITVRFILTSGHRVVGGRREAIRLRHKPA